MRLFKFATITTAAMLFASATAVWGQDVTPEKELPATAVKNQANSGTCWSFATVSFLESELLRKGKGTFDLSEIFFVRSAYPTKAERSVRLQGHVNFSGGGQAHDVLDVWRTRGAVVEDAYSGLIDGATYHDHMEMDAILEGTMKTVVSPDISTIDTKWKAAMDSLLNLYIGNTPKKFDYNGKTYTPEDFAASLPIDPDDYIELTSFTHHPYYSTFALEVPDNWSSGSYYNLPLEELLQVMQFSIAQGYTFVWDGDVSGEVSFGENEGIAKATEESKRIDAKMRQEAFDSFITTDDHLMHITGIGADASGKKYFLTKNSWGDNKGIRGYWWLSENFVRMNTIAIMVHKDAIPLEIARKLKLK